MQTAGKHFVGQFKKILCMNVQQKQDDTAATHANAPATVTITQQQQPATAVPPANNASLDLASQLAQATTKNEALKQNLIKMKKKILDTSKFLNFHQQLEQGMHFFWLLLTCKIWKSKNWYATHKLRKLKKWKTNWKS